jgi:hypothetical protein
MSINIQRTHKAMHFRAIGYIAIAAAKIYKFICIDWTQAPQPFGSAPRTKYKPFVSELFLTTLKVDHARLRKN